MATAQSEVEAQKRAAAERALELVRPGTIIGLGTGTTARYFIDGLARRVRNGLKVQAVVTSLESRTQAEAGGISVTERIDGWLDLTVDGADEIDPAVNCVKGRGGALLREKIVAHASQRFILVADESKLVVHLGRGPVPIEILPFLWEATSRSIESLGGRPELRMAAGAPFRTDNGNLILDTSFANVDPELSVALNGVPGVIEHGLFFGMAKTAIIGSAAGIRILGELG
ncbi:MAG TPA: ribose-5-phosphate isomerase RpiA [Candidatus Dormibacteraeota bacterium]|nr:ribose-5-phosphate isomerase RpiA [Candidatus Dormibacteraeota bacterium]